MAYPLKVLVFAAQVKSGMWRRNGFSVQHQVQKEHDTAQGGRLKELFVQIFVQYTYCSDFE